MGHDHSECDGEQANKTRMQLVYARRVEEKRYFMQELTNYRKTQHKALLTTLVKSVGPNWYHTLSIPQRDALDNLKFSIYQDEIEGRPVRTHKLIKRLGIYPTPTYNEIMVCIDEGKKDTKEMLAVLFYIMCGHYIDVKSESYHLNGKILLSSILYLGLKDLMRRLKEKFQPDEEEKEETKEKPKMKKPPQLSPYLQKHIAVLYSPPKKKRVPPPPLPNLEGSFNEPVDSGEEPVIIKSAPPPPPPPPPVVKKKLPRYYCDELAGMHKYDPPQDMPSGNVNKLASTKKFRTLKHSKMNSSTTSQLNKAYGLNLGKPKPTGKRRPLVAPSTGLQNTQYTINGIQRVAGRKVFILGNVTILPPDGEIIHGGFVFLHGLYINVHCGHRAHKPEPLINDCDCLEKWEKPVMQYLYKNKCRCGHFYDYGNEGTFGPDEVPFFEKPTTTGGFKFNHDAIYDTNKKSLIVKKEVRKLWDTDSLLNEPATSDQKEKRRIKKKKVSKTSLKENVAPEDYLKIALRCMRNDNTAARLPDIHLVPELKEWMRKRIHGPYTREQKAEFLMKSNNYWTLLSTLAKQGHVHPTLLAKFKKATSWNHKLELSNSFQEYTKNYKIKLFHSLAKVNNILWPSMCQAECPDKRFREIYYSYLCATIDDLHLIRPYSTATANSIKSRIWKRRYICRPAGAADVGL